MNGLCVNLVVKNFAPVLIFVKLDLEFRPRISTMQFMKNNVSHKICFALFCCGCIISAWGHFY